MAVMCPVCSAHLAGQEKDCPKCHTDLSAYLAVQYAPDLLYNEAMQLVESGEYRAAYDRLAAAQFMRPHDTDILMGMAHCAELAGDYVGAMEKLAMLVVTGESDSLKREYERLSTLLEEQKREDNTRSAMDEKAYAEIKELILQALREATGEIIASVAQSISYK